ncbi:MAG: aminodeoxychorismate lyase [Methylococcales symbiont of Iophon sp. n. MRB-2018]|nr:MAG: aminodeoxychorismate lyase [Methylococcales symbiont of Iophon sp. n. MRB-2018]KAF3979002.1 MAG: aminodeoxychorismate lyase [Methylococcales symbiont of Iophon sp. n. MRB-2018]
MYLLNGENKQILDFSDRGFQYGDGLFETISVQNGIPLFLDLHFQRLITDCKKLLIPPPDNHILQTEAFQLAKGVDCAVLKLIVTRGLGGRGYRQPEKVSPTRLFSLHPFPIYPKNYFQSGISACFCNVRLGLNSTLAGIKHLNRLEQVMARAEWETLEIQEGLMLDLNENIIEGTMSNFFLIKDNILMTPILDLCGVEGILKKIIINLARDHNIEVVEKKISKNEVLIADELFVTNSIIDIWPIKKIESKRFEVGEMTKKLQSAYLILKQEAIYEV